MTTPGPPAGPTGADLSLDPEEPVVGRSGSPGADRSRPASSGLHRKPGPGLTGSGDQQPGSRRAAGSRSRSARPGSTDAGGAGDYGRGRYDAEPAGAEPFGAEPFGATPDPLGADEAQAELAEEAAATAGSAEEPGASLVRSSGVMAVGTLASRVTGFLRTAILIYALGTHYLGDAYNIANTLPNAVYNLALGGILTSVVVPLLVSAAKRDRDRGEAYDQRIFTIGVLALGGITVVATLAAAPIADLYGHGLHNAAAHHLTVIFAYFFIPQIFFYGVCSLAGAILNARGRFGAPMWTPVVNNVVVIVVGAAFMVVAGVNRTPSDISAGEIALLGFGTTLGIVMQTAALVPSLRAAGFRWRPRYDFRRAEVAEIGRMGGWMFGYVLTTQIAFLITTVVANEAGSKVPQQGAGAGFAAYSNAWQLFQLPYAIVGISVITAMLPRMSAHAAARRYRLVSGDFSTATRLAAVIVVPAALVLAVLGAPLAEGVFGYGSTSLASARYLGEIFAVFSLGLLPYMLFQLLLRVFYATHDSRTPALIGLGTMTVNITANLIALAVLPPAHVVAGLGAGFGLANLVGTIAAWYILSRRLGGMDGRKIGGSLVRMHGAAIPAVLFAIAVSLMINVIVPAGRLNALVTVALAGCGALLLYVLFAKALGLTELDDLTASVRARIGR
jgi:putative peptidoglycan lipid II flippase